MDFDPDDFFDIDPNLPLPDFDSCDFFASAASTSSLPSSLPSSTTQPMVSTRNATKRKRKAENDKPAHNPKPKVPIASSTAVTTQTRNLNRSQRLSFLKKLKPPILPSKTTVPVDKDHVSLEGKFCSLLNQFLFNKFITV